MGRLVHVRDAVARRWPKSPLCLQRSLVLVWLMRRRGLPARLRIGVLPEGGSLIAHAWVDLEGDALDAPDAEQLSPLEASTPYRLQLLGYAEVTR